MRRSILLFIIFLILPLAAQNNQNDQDNQNQEENENSGAVSPGQVEWGASFDTVKENVKGALTHVERNKVIVSKEGEIVYTYGFFYPDPELTGEDEIQEPAGDQPAGQGAQENQQDQGNEQQADNGPQYSYVVMQFPYLLMDDIKKKYTEKYGEPSSEAVENNRGVIVWEKGDTMITMWIDEYEKKAYCRKINYLSTEYTEKLAGYKERIFNKKELDTLNRIAP